MTVAAVNDAPVAVPDSATGLEDEVLEVLAPSRQRQRCGRHGRRCAEGYLVTPPVHGIVVDGDGGYYTPDENANKLTIGLPGVATTDSFTYKVTDPSGDISDVVAVTITIEPVNDTPIAVGDFYDVEEDVALVVAAPGVLENDRDIDLDTLTANLQETVLNGTLVFGADGSFYRTLITRVLTHSPMSPRMETVEPLGWSLSP